MSTAVASMPEAEVTLCFAFWHFDRATQPCHADIAIDGAHVRIRAHSTQDGRQVPERIVFPIWEFLSLQGCHPARTAQDEWQGLYQRQQHSFTIRSKRGFDVIIRYDVKGIGAECKGGLLQPKGQGAFDILAAAVGKVVISDSSSTVDELWVAVPDSPAFETAGRRVLAAHVFAKTGIRIGLVSRDGVRPLN